nr:GGDEF domain-containing protein [Lachnospiraceae bacterium]
VLVEVADKLRQIFSEYDCIGRIGGDEFAVLLNVPEGMNLETNNLVEVKARALNNSLRTTYSDGDIRVNVSASIGIAKYDENSKDYNRLYKHADEILYYSKRRGKDQYNFYEKIDELKKDEE